MRSQSKRTLTEDELPFANAPMLVLSFAPFDTYTHHFRASVTVLCPTPVCLQP